MTRHAPLRGLVRALHRLVLLTVLVAVPLSDAGAADRSGDDIRVTVHDGRVSVLAEGASIEDIARAMTDRTGVHISVVTRHRLVATVMIEDEPLDRAVERVLRATSPPVDAYSIFSYHDERLAAINVIVSRRKLVMPVVGGADGDMPGDPDDAGALEARFIESAHGMLIEEIRQAGVDLRAIDLAVVAELADAGVSMPEILAHLTSELRGAGTAALQPNEPQLLAPSGEADRTLRQALRHAGVPDTQLDEMTLLAAQQLRAAGVPLHEIRENLDAVASGAARADDAASVTRSGRDIPLPPPPEPVP